VTFVSLFSGIGGIDLGLERAGMRCVAQVEIDPFCRRVLAKHWPDVPKFDDVRTFNRDSIQGDVDLIAGGFPCQGISNANDGGEGLADLRSGLWSEFARIVREFRPRFALVENVAALLVPDESGAAPISTVLGDLAACGYDAEWDCIPAGAFGFPHFRNRVFVVAYPGEVGNEGPRHGRQPRCFGSGFEPSWTPSDPNWVEAWVIEQFRNGEAQPLLRGETYGLRDWVDRIGGPGNAVVPQVAEWIGRRIMSANAPAPSRRALSSEVR